MQNPFHKHMQVRRKQVLIERKDSENFFQQCQNPATWVEKASSQSQMIQDDSKSTAAEVAYKKNILPITPQGLKRQHPEIQGENGRKEVKRMPLLILESVQRLSTKQDPEADTSTSTKTEETPTNLHLCQDIGIITVHMNEIEVEGLCQRAKAYVRLIQPDLVYVKFGQQSKDIMDWPLQIEGYVEVTKEDNRWRKEFQYQEKVPEGTVLLRPWVTMTILIAMIVCQSPDKMLMATHVYEAIQRRFPYFLYMPKKEQVSWKNQIRHFLYSKKWFSRVQFRGHTNLHHSGYYWTFNYDNMPDNWNLSARSIRNAIKPMGEILLKDKVLGSNREASPSLGNTMMPDLQSDQTEDSRFEPMTSAMTLTPPGTSVNNIWDIVVPRMPDHAQKMSPTNIQYMKGLWSPLNV